MHIWKLMLNFFLKMSLASINTRVKKKKFLGSYFTVHVAGLVNDVWNQ